MEHLIVTSSQLANVLKSRRKALQCTQKEIGSRVGLLPKTVSALESEPDRCGVESLRKLLSALNLEIILVPRDDASISDQTGAW